MKGGHRRQGRPSSHDAADCGAAEALVITDLWAARWSTCCSGGSSAEVVVEDIYGSPPVVCLTDLRDPLEEQRGGGLPVEFFSK